jgi:nicotinamidase-related amidase
MVVGNNGNVAECVVVDLNTQLDFLSPTGAWPVANASRLIGAIRNMIAWTKRNHVPVISSLKSRREYEIEQDGSPQHCIDGTSGQRKLVCTLFGCSIRIEGDNTLSVPSDLFSSYQQVIFRQRTQDLFGNPKADRFLTQLPTRQFVIYGVALETSVKALALGLLARNRRVAVVADACGYWSRSESDLALRQMEAKGAEILTVEKLLARKLSRRFRYPLRGWAPMIRDHDSAHDRMGCSSADGRAMPGDLPHGHRADGNGRTGGRRQ